jgi:hypothetical protein
VTDVSSGVTAAEIDSIDGIAGSVTEAAIDMSVTSSTFHR